MLIVFFLMNKNLADKRMLNTETAVQDKKLVLVYKTKLTTHFFLHRKC